MEGVAINHAAVWVAAISDFLVGALWFSPLLCYRVWMKSNGLVESDLQKGNPGIIYGGTFVLALLISYLLAFFLASGEAGWAWGLAAGFLTGLGFATASLAIIALFERRSWSYVAVHAGYLTLAFSLKGLIIGAW